MAINKSNRPEHKTAIGQAFEEASFTSPNAPEFTPEPQHASHANDAYNASFTDQSDIWRMSGFGIINDNLSSFKESLENVMKNVPKTVYDTTIIPVDSGSLAWGFDTVLVCATQNNVPGAYTGVYVITLANSDDTLGEVTVPSFDGTYQHTVMSYPSLLAAHPDAQDYILDYVTNYFNDGRGICFAGGDTLYTNTVDLKEPKLLYQILENAIKACATKALDATATDKNMVHDVVVTVPDGQQKTALSVERRLDSGVTQDIHGRPIRSDWVFGVSARSQQKEKGGSALPGVVQRTNQPLFTINGFTDYVMLPPDESLADNNSYWDNANVNRTGGERIFMPVQVFTRIQNINKTSLPSLGNLIYALGAGIGSIYSDQYYARMAMNPSQRPENWEHSIAGLGYEASHFFNHEGFEPFPVDHKEFSENDYRTLLNRYFCDTTSFAIMVGKGPDSWMWRDFVEAGMEEADGENGLMYNNKILERTDYIFGGKFMPIYNKLLEVNGSPTQRVVHMNKSRRYLIGSYINNHDKRERSLQDVDRAFLDNQINGNRQRLDLTHSYINAINNSDMSMEQSIGLQQEIIRDLLPNAEITGYGHFLELDNIYVMALYECMDKYGPTLYNTNHSPVTTNRIQYGNARNTAVGRFGGNMLRSRSFVSNNGGFGRSNRW